MDDYEAIAEEFSSKLKPSKSKTTQFKLQVPDDPKPRRCSESARESLDLSKCFDAATFTQKELSNMLYAPEEPVKISGRVLPSPVLMYHSNSLSWPIKDGDWTDLIQCRMFYNSNDILDDWCVLSPTKLNLQNYQLYMWLMGNDKNYGRSLRMPQIKYWSNKKDLEAVLDEVIVENPRMVLVIVPDVNESRGALIKRKLFVKNAILCQMMPEETFTKYTNQDENLLQIKSKLGSVSWNVKSSKGFMFIGLEVRVDRLNGQKIGGFVATMDQRKSDFYFSETLPHETGQELAESLAKATLKAVEAYLSRHNKLPAGIVLYRRKTDEDQAGAEVKELSAELEAFYKKYHEKCRMAFVMVDKENPARFYVDRETAPPGTVVDQVVTHPGRSDFYLVSEKVSKNVIATLTYYHVIQNSLEVSEQVLQKITYDQCHMNFTCASVCRVPAVSQYAENLAVLVAETLHETPNDGLNGKLYFL